MWRVRWLMREGGGDNLDAPGGLASFPDKRLFQQVAEGIVFAENAVT